MMAIRAVTLLDGTIYPIKVMPSGRIPMINKIKRGRTVHYLREKAGRYFWHSEMGIAEDSDDYFRLYAEVKRGTELTPDFLETLKTPEGRGFDVELERAARTRARKAGRSYELPPGWIQEQFRRQGGRCAVSQMTMHRDRSKRSPYAPSIDRTDSSGGYIPENCRLVCYIVNCGRNMFTDAEFLRMCRHVVAANEQSTNRESVIFLKPNVSGELS